MAPENLRAMMHYFRACHWEARHDAAKQRECLDKAGKDDPHGPGRADRPLPFARRAAATTPRSWSRSSGNALLIHGKIPTSPVPSVYNEYAWLIGNTEGDFDEAVKCSFKSIEISPEEGGLYDTLGHVYFGKGDWEKAVKYQAMAAESRTPIPAGSEKALAQFRKKFEEKQEVKRVNAAGVDLWCEDRGSGLPLLLVHGFPLDHTMWAGQLALAAARRRCWWASASNRPARRRWPDDFCRRCRRSGSSPPTCAASAKPRTGRDGHHAGVRRRPGRALDALGVEGPVVYCGLSMGGYIGWQFWRRHREQALAG